MKINPFTLVMVLESSGTTLRNIKANLRQRLVDSLDGCNDIVGPREAEAGFVEDLKDQAMRRRSFARIA